MFVFPLALNLLTHTSSVCVCVCVHNDALLSPHTTLAMRPHTVLNETPCRIGTNEEIGLQTWLLVSNRTRWHRKRREFKQECIWSFNVYYAPAPNRWGY